MEQYFELDKLFLNCYFVIESLGEDDQATGSELYNDIIRRRCDQQNQHADLFCCSNLREMEDVLYALISITGSEQCHPLIHFESHGNARGLICQSGELFSWNRLCNFLRKINRNCRNNLYVSVASCYGGHIQHGLKITELCPFRAFIGPQKEVTGYDLLTDFTTFFETLFKTNSFDKALQRLNLEEDSSSYYFFTAETFFDKLIRSKVDELTTQDKLEDFVRQVAKQMFKRQSKTLSKVLTKGQFQKAARRHLDIHGLTAELRQIFLNPDFKDNSQFHF